jgi:hypothetical protein
MTYFGYSIRAERPKIAILQGIIALIDTDKTRYAGRKSGHGSRRYTEIKLIDIFFGRSKYRRITVAQVPVI